MSRYKLLFLSSDDFFKSALAEQLEQQKEYDILAFASDLEAEEVINNQHFDCFLVDTESLAKVDFINKLSDDNQQKPFVFFIGANTNSNVMNNNVLLDENKYIRQALYRPFALENLINILKSSLNKYEKGVGSIIKIGEFKLDQGQKQLLDDNNQVIAKLTEKEVDILRHLYKNKNQAIKKEKLLEQVWGYSPDMDTHTLETHIYRLRQKIGLMAKYLITDDKGYSIALDE